MAKQKKLVVANWKMNPPTHTDASELLKGITRHAGRMKNVDTVICPPFVFLDKLVVGYTGTAIAFGGQDIFYKEGGAFTGEVSGAQLYSVGADYVIVGHSERRALGESDDDVSLKVEHALAHDLTPIVCVGESNRDTQGKYLHFLRNQITLALKHVKQKDISKVVIAYEPIWAIGKMGKDAITPHKLHETTLYIRRVLRETYNTAIAEKVIVLYGGSVKPENAKELLNEGEVQGFLVGGASLDAESFNDILSITDQ